MGCKKSYGITWDKESGKWEAKFNLGEKTYRCGTNTNKRDAMISVLRQCRKLGAPMIVTNVDLPPSPVAEVTS